MSRFTSILAALTMVAVPLPALAQRAQQQQQQQQQGGSSLFGSNALQSGQQGSSGLTGGTSGGSSTGNGGSSGGSQSSSSTGTSTGGQFGAGRAEMGDVFGRASDQGFIGRGQNDQQQSGNARNGGGNGARNGGRTGNNRGQANGRNNRNAGNNGGFSFNNGFGQQQSGNSRQGGSARSQTVRPVYRMAIEAPAARPDAAVRQVSSRFRSQGATSPLAGVNAAATGATLVLQGRVASEYDRRLAEQVARLEPGIGAIDNQIVVGSQP